MFSETTITIINSPHKNHTDHTIEWGPEWLNKSEIIGYATQSSKNQAAPE